MPKEKIEKTQPGTVSLSDLAERIRAREVEIEQQKDRAMLQIAITLNKVVEQGDDLIAAKAQCRHGEWESWVETNCPFNSVTAWRYMRISNLSHVKDLEDGASIRQAYIAAGLLPEPEPQEEGAVGRVETWRAPINRLGQMLRIDNLKRFEPAVIETIEHELVDLLARVRAVRGNA